MGLKGRSATAIAVLMLVLASAEAARATPVRDQGISAVAAATTATPAVQWLCRPGVMPDPCTGDQTTTRTAPEGQTATQAVPVPVRPKLDCFYVYPTVSNQASVNATATPDPEVRSIATYQAQRFSTLCRVFAPLYRQVTVAGVSIASQTHDVAPYETAYSDVEAAFTQYLRQDNHGRPFVLIGHSQGSRMLRALLRRVIDPNRSLRHRMVAAIIPGANATIHDDPHIPACSRPAEYGCIVAYSTFDEQPPSNSRFGRTDTDPVGSALGLPGGPVLCTDPTQLSGTGGRLESLVPTARFAPGFISVLLIRLYGGLPPTASTPWLEPQDHYTARCEQDNGANVLMTSPVGSARHLNPSPDPTWGIHLVDVNLALGNLLTIVDRSGRAWLRSHASVHHRGQLAPVRWVP